MVRDFLTVCYWRIAGFNTKGAMLAPAHQATCTRSLPLLQTWNGKLCTLGRPLVPNMTKS